MPEISVGQFFDSLTSDYTETIERCFPRYREMLWALLDYLPAEQAPKLILELGCGTGNCSVLLSEAFPQASIRLVDISAESLDECSKRLGEGSRLQYQQGDFQKLEFDADSFDLVVASISIHHLKSDAKQKLFADVYQWLRPNGIIAIADQFRGATDSLYDRHIGNWKQLSLNAGSSEEEFAMWMDHQRKHDHHDPLHDQLDWLGNAGFVDIDCVWRYLLWAVVQGRKL